MKIYATCALLLLLGAPWVPTLAAEEEPIAENIARLGGDPAEATTWATASGDPTAIECYLQIAKGLHSETGRERAYIDFWKAYAERLKAKHGGTLSDYLDGMKPGIYNLAHNKSATDPLGALLADYEADRARRERIQRERDDRP